MSLLIVLFALGLLIFVACRGHGVILFAAGGGAAGRAATSPAFACGPYRFTNREYLSWCMQ
ncbi:hypothetical protein LRH25_22890 [Ideonella azotifigens]|uniref:Secreted protein n=1 Tax=Ideonella azotifigens TaxID=513160 RepID=A0ABP3V410_9BURK|nr:hypothetical protein [Ideonella azotifigens]MCD2343177.1 hypothetical protein [Ideonella azotifigens]